MLLSRLDGFGSSAMAHADHSEIFFGASKTHPKKEMTSVSCRRSGHVRRARSHFDGGSGVHPPPHEESTTMCLAFGETPTRPEARVDSSTLGSRERTPFPDRVVPTDALR
jgi:hypothetical protein